MTKLTLHPGYIRACLQVIYWIFFKPITFGKYVHQLAPQLIKNYSWWEVRKYWHSDLTRFMFISLGCLIMAPMVISFPINLLIKIVSAGGG